jgi:hypothetical protein
MTFDPNYIYTNFHYIYIIIFPQEVCDDIQTLHKIQNQWSSY